MPGFPESRRDRQKFVAINAAVIAAAMRRVRKTRTPETIAVHDLTGRIMYIRPTAVNGRRV